VHTYTGTVLAHEDAFSEGIRARYAAPFADCHRVDLQRALVRRAEELGVNIVLGARVTGIDFGAAEGSEARVSTAGGEGYVADLVVGADGLWSTCRSAMLGQRDAPLPTGDLAFRIVLEAEKIEDAELRAMVERPACKFWAGPGAHAVAYSVRGGKMYNVVLLVPDDLAEGVARTKGNVEEMRGLFRGWDPVCVYLPLHAYLRTDEDLTTDSHASSPASTAWINGN
jgi:salicylate hydroxylase